MKRFMTLLSITVTCCLLLTACGSMIGGKNTNRIYGNTLANLNCGGMAVEYDGTTYFSTGNGVYAQESEGIRQVYDTPMIYLNVSDDGMLYGITLLDSEEDTVGVVGMKLDGTARTVLYRFGQDVIGMRDTFLAWYDHALLIQSGDVLLRLDLSSNKTSVLARDVGEMGIRSVVMDEEWIYYPKVDSSAGFGRNEFYRVSLDGKKAEKCSEAVALLLRGGDFISPVSGETVYRLQPDDGQEIVVETIHTDAGEKRFRPLKTIGKKVDGPTEDIPLWVSGDTMYCVMNLADDSGEALCRISFSHGAGEIRVLSTGDFYGYWINVIQNTAYCIPGSSDDEPVLVVDCDTGEMTSLPVF